MCSNVMAKLWILVVFILACFLSFGFGVRFEAHKPYARTGEMTAGSTNPASQTPDTHAPTSPYKYGTPDTLGTQTSYGEDPTTGAKTGEGWTESQVNFQPEVNLEKVTVSVVNPDEVIPTPFKVFQARPTDSSEETSLKDAERPTTSSRSRSGIKFERVSEEPSHVRTTSMPHKSVDGAEVPPTVPTEVVVEDSLLDKTDGKHPSDDAERTSTSAATRAETDHRLSAKLHKAFNSSLGKSPKKFFGVWHRKSKTSTQASSGAVGQTSYDNRMTTFKAQSPAVPIQQEFTASQTSSVKELETAAESSAITSPKSSELPACSPIEQLSTMFQSSTTAAGATPLESLATGAAADPPTTSSSTSTTDMDSPEDEVALTEVLSEFDDDLLDSGSEFWQPKLRMFPDDVTREDLICTEIVLRSCLLEHLGLTSLDPESLTPKEINRTCHHRFMINSCVRFGHKICRRSVPLVTGSYAVLNNICKDTERHIKYINSLPNRKRVSQPELERCLQALECQFMNITIESGLERNFQDIICLDEHLRQFCYSMVWAKGHATSLKFFEYCQHRLEVLYWMGFERLGCKPNSDLICFPPKKIIDGDYKAMNDYVSYLLRRLEIL